MIKPVRLEINDAGSWRLITRFDAEKDDQAQEILNTAAELGNAINWDTPPGKRGVTLRMSVDNDTRDVLCHWSQASGWREARTGDPL